jgi:transcriptional regulator of acetoin/glycerol metabolism
LVHQPQNHQPAIVQPLQVNNNTPVLINDDIQHHEEVEESLNIMDKEKELIIKALKKHKSRRKDASADLGISERTLYRKLKEYDIDDL